VKSSCFGVNQGGDYLCGGVLLVSAVYSAVKRFPCTTSSSAPPPLHNPLLVCGWNIVCHANEGMSRALLRKVEVSPNQPCSEISCIAAGPQFRTKLGQLETFWDTHYQNSCQNSSTPHTYQHHYLEVSKGKCFVSSPTRWTFQCVIFCVLWFTDVTVP
jgi:hypothetical protein